MCTDTTESVRHRKICVRILLNQLDTKKNMCTDTTESVRQRKICVRILLNQLDKEKYVYGYY